MKTILIMRHAKSDWNTGEKDFDRPLNPRGLKAAPEMAAFLLAQNKIPDLIIASPAERAKTTCFLVKEKLNFQGQILWNPLFYFGNEDNMFDALFQLDDTIHCVLMIGHNPTVENFVSKLTVDYKPMPTATIVSVVANINSWSNLKYFENAIQWTQSPKKQ